MNLINNKISYEDSLYLYKSFQPTSLSNEVLPPEKADNKDFFDDFPGNLIQKPQYSDCRFYGSNFNSSNGVVCLIVILIIVILDIVIFYKQNLYAMKKKL